MGDGGMGGWMDGQTDRRTDVWMVVGEMYGW